MQSQHTLPASGGTDAALLTAVLEGKLEPYGELYERYYPMARAIAFQHTSNVHQAEDIVSEAFARILQALKNGKGPHSYLGGYLATTIAHLAGEYGLLSAKEVPSEQEHLEAMGTLDETVLQLHESDEVISAFTSLPERWQTVLWLTEIEAKKPREIATAMALSPNAVSALALRAKESLKEGFLRAHQNAPATPDCNRFSSHISPYVRGSLSQKRSDALRSHMESCNYCTTEYLSLVGINKSMRSWIFPVLAGLSIWTTDGAAIVALAAAAALPGGDATSYNEANTNPANGEGIHVLSPKTWASSGQLIAGAATLTAATVAIVSGIAMQNTNESSIANTSADGYSTNLPGKNQKRSSEHVAKETPSPLGAEFDTNPFKSFKNADGSAVTQAKEPSLSSAARGRSMHSEQSFADGAPNDLVLTEQYRSIPSLLAAIAQDPVTVTGERVASALSTVTADSFWPDADQGRSSLVETTDGFSGQNGGSFAPSPEATYVPSQPGGINSAGDQGEGSRATPGADDNNQPAAVTNDVPAVTPATPETPAQPEISGGEATPSPVEPANPAAPTDSAQPTDPADPTQPTDPVEPVDPTQPTDPIDPVTPVDPVDPTQPTDPVEPTDPANPADPTQPTEPADPADPTQPTDPVDPVDPANPADPGGEATPSPVDPATPADPTQPTEPTDPADPTQPTDPADPTQPTDPVEPTDPANPADPADPTQPTDPVEPVDPANPADPGGEATPSPVDPANPAEPTQPTEPTNPADPTQPTNPVDPVDPTEPAQPTDPVDPVTPVDPADPTDPTSPTGVDGPMIIIDYADTEPPVEDIPTEPAVTPANPGKAVHPEKPSLPGAVPSWYGSKDFKKWRASVPWQNIGKAGVGDNKQCTMIYVENGKRLKSQVWLPAKMIGAEYTNYSLAAIYQFDSVESVTCAS